MLKGKLSANNKHVRTKHNPYLIYIVLHAKFTLKKINGPILVTKTRATEGAHSKIKTQ